ncbi:MAG TPA: sigma 54-interacting transcriptional regulator [Planctomycetota bacterium]|nr:sigma 54-interacting transcriptional regulator [Planctomycetota bacterium]
MKQRAPDEDRARLDSRLSILQEISLALNSTLEPDKLIELILDLSIRYTGATTGSLILITEDRCLDIVAARGLGANVKDEVRLRVGEGITGWVAIHGRPLNVPDVLADERYIMVKEHIRSELAVPMVLNKRVIGVISVDSTCPANFNDDDLQLLTIVGTQAAQILENARTFADLQLKARQDETLLEISQALGSALDLEELFKSVMEILSRRCHMTRGFLVLSDPERDELAIEIAYGLTPEQVAKGRYQKGEGIIGTVFRTGKPYGAKDTRFDPQFLGRTGAIRPVDETLSFLAGPIHLENQVTGVFGVVKVFAGDAEFETDMALVQIVASTLSQAVKIHRGVAREKAKLIQENRLLREELGTRYRFDNIVGSSSAMQKVFSIITNVAPSRSTVLIRGESGTGKELIAHAIHFNSPRAEKPFVRVNCAAIPEHLLEAELFGHLKGSFTGAFADRKGKFVLADGGTIFLDEIGDMSPLLQAKILRVLQEREVEAVGAESVVKVDVRVLAATHQNLEALIEQKKFREDLYYRLNVVPIHVPPLRERLEDIRVLAEHFHEKFRKENGLPDLKFSPEAVRMLMRYRWPGNVRELENAVERAVVLSDGKLIQPLDFPGILDDAVPALEAGRPGPKSLAEAVSLFLDGSLGGPPPDGQIWDKTFRTVEEVLIRRALDRVKGVRLQAADLLGIHRNTLRKKLNEVD